MCMCHSGVSTLRLSLPVCLKHCYSFGRPKLQHTGKWTDFINFWQKSCIAMLLVQCRIWHTTVGCRAVSWPSPVAHWCNNIHPFNGPLSGTTRLSRYQKGKTNLDFTEAKDSERQWNQLGRMQICTSLQTDNHASTPPLSFLQAGCPSCHPTNSVKALKRQHWCNNYNYNNNYNNCCSYIQLLVVQLHCDPAQWHIDATTTTTATTTTAAATYNCWL